MGRPGGPPFTLNKAIDTLLKQEFDVLRQRGERHALMEECGIDAMPVRHEKLEEWRENFKGVQYLHEPTNFIVTGAIDDLWRNPKGDYIVAEYKSTSAKDRITGLDKDWHAGYKRQVEVYQWLLRRNGLLVSDTAYFVYCNGLTVGKVFDKKLEFEISVIPYEGSDNWVEGTLGRIHACLAGDGAPQGTDDCKYCAYAGKVAVGGEVRLRGYVD